MLEFLASTVLMIILASVFWLFDKIIVRPVVWLLVVGHRPHWEAFTWVTRSVTFAVAKQFRGSIIRRTRTARPLLMCATVGSEAR